jgi:ABC-type siderophore export system fused ATPase/permease subunit
MTLRESELSRSQHAQRTHQKQIKRKLLTKQQFAKRKLEIAKARKQRLDLLPAVLNDNQVLRFSEWCALNDISPRTARRLFARGDGPATTQLSPKRIGITVRANKEWQARRERA